MKTTIFLFIMGILLCSPLAVSTNNETITLTPDNHILFSGVVTDASVTVNQLKLGQLSARLPRNATIYLVLDTPGGSVPAGNLFIDFAKSLPQKIKPISIFAASMGYHMFQSFDERIMQSSSTIMSHRVSLSGLSGQVPGELVTRLNSIISISNQMDDVASKRVGLSRKDYQDLIHDELWLSGSDAVATGHADKLAKISCSEELINGTRIEQVDTLFGPLDVKFSACPLISGYISFEISKVANTSGVVYQTPKDNGEVAKAIKFAKRKVVMGVVW